MTADNREWDAMLDLARESGSYICDECVVRYGGKPRVGHRYTKHEGDCDYCGHRYKMLAALTDWHWPNPIPDAPKEVTNDV